MAPKMATSKWPLQPRGPKGKKEQMKKAHKKVRNGSVGHLFKVTKLMGHYCHHPLIMENPASLPKKLAPGTAVTGCLPALIRSGSTSFSYGWGPIPVTTMNNRLVIQVIFKSDM